jgi:hypothetical protein
MRLLPYVVALIGVLALVGWFSWDARRPLAASRRDTRDSTNPDDAASPCPTPHWHNPGVGDGRR